MGRVIKRPVGRLEWFVIGMRCSIAGLLLPLGATSDHRGGGGRGVRRRLKDALPDSDERELMEPPQVSPGSARAPVEGSPADGVGRFCPICGEPLRPRQRVCSGRCRAELSRRRQAQARQARDEQVRALLFAALALMGPDGPP